MNLISSRMVNGSRPPEPALGAFGEKLRKQREQRGLALDAISNTTKISTRMLRALEDEHFDQLPGGVFNKGFVRAYARQVGLDEEEALADYLLALRESQIQQQSILPDFRTPASRSHPIATPDPQQANLPGNEGHKGDPATVFSGPEKTDGRDGSHDARSRDIPNKEIAGDDLRHDSLRHDDRRKTDRRHQRQDDTPANVPHRPDPPAKRAPKYPAGDPAESVGVPAQIPWGKLAIALLVVALALALWNLRRHGYLAAAPRPADAAQASPTPVPPPASQASTPSNAVQVSSAGALSPGKVSPAPTTTGSQLGKSSSTPPTNPTPSPASSKATSAPPSASSANAANALSKKPAPAPKPLPTFTLLIRAEKTTWVQITADDKPVSQETLIAPAHTSIRATHEIVVKAGNAAGISFQFNGKEIPAQGDEGEVKTYVFDPTTVHVQPQTQPLTNR